MYQSILLHMTPNQVIHIRTIRHRKKTGSNESLPIDSHPSTSIPPKSPHDPAVKPQPIINLLTGATPIGNIDNTRIETDQSHPRIVSIPGPNTPGGAQTLTARSDPIVISGTTISVNPTSGAVVVIGVSTLQPVGIVNRKPIFTDPNQPGIDVVIDPESDQPTQTFSVSGTSVVIDVETLILPPTASVQHQPLWPAFPSSC
jgi:hypothetical protein